MMVRTNDVSGDFYSTRQHNVSNLFTNIHGNHSILRDWLFFSLSLSLSFSCFHHKLSQHFVCVHACILLPLWHHCQNRMIYNYLKSFDFLLLSLCFKHIYSSSSLFEIDYTSLVILDVIFLTFCIRITFTLFIHVLLRPYIGSIMLSHLLLTLCSAIRI